MMYRFAIIQLICYRRLLRTFLFSSYFYCPRIAHTTRPFYIFPGVEQVGDGFESERYDGVGYRELVTGSNAFF